MVFGKMKASIAGLRAKLTRTNSAISECVENAGKAESREKFLENLEETLITADIGVSTSLDIVNKMRGVYGGRDVEKLRQHLRDSIFNILVEVEKPI